LRPQLEAQDGIVVYPIKYVFFSCIRQYNGT
jgi:hypothetical protein